jgi:monoamine oxidase
MGTYGADLPVAFDCAVTAIDHSGLRLRIETTQGALAANQAVVTVPSTIIADQRIRFVPEIPEKIEAARKLPLGVVDKIFIACDQPEMFPKEGHFFGSVNRVDTGSYHLRPFGRPMIEVFFAGTVAETLERAGASAGCAFAIEELVDLLGSDVRKRLRGLTASCWGADPFASGSYSRAEVGCVGAREVLARSVDDRLFFAGEACSREGYSSAHGALSSGRDAARRLLGPQHSHIAGAL